MEENIDDPAIEYLHDAALIAILNDDDEDEDAKHMQKVSVNIDEWRRLEGASFKMHFRMKRETFQQLIVVVGHHLRRKGKLQWSQTPLDLSLMYTLWILANPDTFRSVGCNFGKASSTIHHHYSYLIAALSELSEQYIKWPSCTERNHIRLQFENMYGYPGVIGCIDGTFFEITAPMEQKQAYVTRHHSYAFIGQAVCDHNLLYRDVYIGEAGSVGDRRTFSNSPISKVLLRNPDAVGEDEHLLGDCAYPLGKHLLTPYINDGNLSAQRRCHNYNLSRVRASVERSFALLFGKETRSKHHRTYSWPITIDHAMAAFVIHNFRILHEVPGADLYYDIAGPLGNDMEGPDEALIAESALLGALKREYIASLFHVP